jgi:hypothetical protein
VSEGTERPDPGRRLAAANTLATSAALAALIVVLAQ